MELILSINAKTGYCRKRKGSDALEAAHENGTKTRCA